MSAEQVVDMRKIRENNPNWDHINVFSSSIRTKILENGLIKIEESSNVSLKTNHDGFVIKAGKFKAIRQDNGEIEYTFTEDKKVTTNRKDRRANGNENTDDKKSR